ncbi:MAG TPA: Stf0 family sulfotransferase [Pilimelia sp.]|nr:Stf0 family sulfotransferase [Pilimelia sp.]
MITGEPRYDLATAAYDRADGGFDRPRRSVLLCTMRRTGSTLLGEALHRAGGLGCPLEYLHAGFRPRFAARWGTPDLAGYVRALYRYRTDATGTLGIKLFWPDLLAVYAERHPDRVAAYAGTAGPAPAGGGPAGPAPAHRGPAGPASAPAGPAPVAGEPGGAAAAPDFDRLAELVAELFPNPSYVFLWRRDLLRQAISDCRAALSGRWRSLDPPTVAQGRATVDVAQGCATVDVPQIDRRLVWFTDQRRQWTAWFAHLGVTPHEVTHEQLVADYAGTVRRLTARLGGTDPAAAAAPPRLRRQADAESERLAAWYLATTRGRTPAGGGGDG